MGFNIILVRAFNEKEWEFRFNVGDLVVVIVEYFRLGYLRGFGVYVVIDVGFWVKVDEGILVRYFWEF